MGKTHIAIILDRSGSMAGTAVQTVVGYNEHIEQIKEDSKTQEILVSLVTFNGNVYEHFWDENADKLTRAAAEDYVAQGSTALYDAMGYVIDKYQKTTVEDADTADTAYLLIVITDGEENASKQYKSSIELKNRIESLQKDKNWTFTYMGCSKEGLFKMAQKTGMSLGNMALWDNASAGTTAGGLVECAKKLSTYMKRRRKGEVKAADYHAADCDLDEAIEVPDEIKCCAAAPEQFKFKAASYVNKNSRTYSPDSFSFISQNSQCLGVDCSASGDVKGVFATANKQADLVKYYS